MHEESKVEASYLGEVSRGWIKSGVIVVKIEPEVMGWLNEAIIDSFEGGTDSVCIIWGDPENLGQGLHFGVEVSGVCTYTPSPGTGTVKGFAVEKVES